MLAGFHCILTAARIDCTGTTSALNDPHKTGCGDAAKNVACFRKLFQVDELAGWLAEDINSWDSNKSEAENMEL